MNKLLDLKHLKLREQFLSEKQKELLPLVDPRFFPKNKNLYRNKTKYYYETPVELDEDLFHMHPFLDPRVLEQGNVRRFPAGINKKYIWEKYFEDKWVSQGNDLLSRKLEKYIQKNLKYFQSKRKITLLDIGPCGGAITSLFALRAFAKFHLLSKVEISLLDIVPNVLEATLVGEFYIPKKMIKEYHLEYVGNDARFYKALLKNGVLIGVKEWYKEHSSHKPSKFTKKALMISDKNRSHAISVKYYRVDGEHLPKDLKKCDVVLSAYLHHHMNYYGRKLVSKQMEMATRKGGFIGVVDFYVKSFKEYISWYKPHFMEHGDAPPIEYPLVPGKVIASFYKKTSIKEINEHLEKSYLFWGVKK